MLQRSPARASARASAHSLPRAWRPVALACLASIGAVQLPAHAANFNITGPSSSAQTLNAGQTGTVGSAGVLTVSGSTVAVAIGGSNASLTNLGSIVQTGTGRVVRDNTGVSNLVVTNGSTTNSTALMQAAGADVMQMNKSPASVTLNNYGQMISLNPTGDGNQVVDFNAIASGTNIVNNYAGGLMKANEADTVRPGVNGVVNNWGTILSVTTTGSSSDGIDGQSLSGIVVNNAGLVQGARHGITGGQDVASVAYTMGVKNLAGGVIQGDNGGGLNLDGLGALQVVTVDNAGSIIGRGVTGDGDGIDVDGVVFVTNRSGGVIRSVNSFSAVAAGLAFSEGMSVGGGQIVNAGLIEGLVANGNTNAVGRGISLVGNDITTGINAGQREALYADTTVVNQAGGLIRGQSDSALYAGGLTGSGRTVLIQNDAGGTLRGGGTSSAAIVVASDYATTVNNAGLIDGGSSGKAITLGSGQNTVLISGGQAQVLGDIDGGSGMANVLRLDPGVGNTFSYADALSGFASVRIESGTVTLSGVSHFTGTTTIAKGAVLELQGANRLAADSALELAGGRVVLAGAGAGVGQSFSALSLTGSSEMDLGGSTLSFGAIGSVSAGAQLSVTHGGLRFVGNQLGDASFQSLVAATLFDGVHAVARFDGTFTNISAVPEPNMAWLLAAGLVSFAALRRRQAR